MSRIPVLAGLLLLSLLFGEGTAAQDDRTEPLPPPAEGTRSPAGAREQLVQFPGPDGPLAGFIWRPEGTGPFPAVLYNHGSERLPGPKPELGAFFTANGYAFFVPHRRGQGRSPGAYIEDQLAQAPRTDRGRLQVELLDAQVADQLAGLAYLQSLRYVDGSRIAVSGCSYGGIQTVLGAEANPGYRAAVDFAGAAQSWAGNPVLRRRMVQAIQNLVIPIFLLQAENDYDLQPTVALAAELDRLGKPHQARIYPPFGTTRDDGHGGFCFSATAVWGTDVLQFLAAAMPQAANLELTIACPTPRCSRSYWSRAPS